MTVLKKGELVEFIAEQNGWTKKDATTWIEDVFETFESVAIEKKAGFKFGNFGDIIVDVVEAKDKKFRNPQNGEEGMKHVPKHLAHKYKQSKGENSVKVKLANLPTD